MTACLPSLVMHVSLLATILWAVTVQAVFWGPGMLKMQRIENTNLLCDGSDPDIGVGYFTQLLNHSEPSQGMFHQKYFWSTTYWGGPGYPVVLMTPGERALDPYCAFFSYRSLISQFASAIHGAVVLLEHRYWGDSSPYAWLTTETLQHLTLSNAVADLTHFARHVPLPFDMNGTSNAPQAPWILSGGSYGGALAAWTSKLAPDTFWAYHATSAPVQAIYNFWQFFNPIRVGMALNCSTDLEAIMAYVDRFLETQSPTRIEAFKADWGLSALRNNIDFAAAIVNSVNTWMDSLLTSGYTTFFQMCDAIEGFGTNTTNASTAVRSHSRPGTAGVAHKVANFAAWYKTEFIPGWCYGHYPYDEYNDPLSVGCLDTYNTSSILYTDRTVDNSANVQWAWMLCNEPLGYWQTGAGPRDTPTISSRFVDTEYYERQCRILFGVNSTASAEGNATTSAYVGTYKYGSAAGRTVDDVNNKTDGWNLNAKRLLLVNGEFDPWRPATVSSSDRPGGPKDSLEDTPVLVVAGGKHCEDLVIGSDMNLMGLQMGEVNFMVRWVNEFYDERTVPGKNRTVPRIPLIFDLNGFG